MRAVFLIAGIVFFLLGLCLLISGCTLTVGVKWGCGEVKQEKVEVKK